MLMGQVPLGTSGKTGQEKDPILRADGEELFFSRAGDPRNQGKDNAADVWFRSRNPDGSWGRAINPGPPINSAAHDQPLALNPDGTQMVVLRNGITNYLDLLERQERNWRIVKSWPIPEGAYPRLDLTFDFNAQRIVYSAYGSSGMLDLYERTALPGGQWSEARPLSELNGAAHSTRPQMASDGRTLFFRKAERWHRQTDRGEYPEEVNISNRLQQFTTAADGSAFAVVVYNDLGDDARLVMQDLPVASLPPAARLVRGYLQAPPGPGATTTTVQLADGRALSVFPDALARYELFLRAGESLPTNENNATAGLMSNYSGTTGLASTGSGPAPENRDQMRLEREIATRERALQRLDAERRRFDLAVPKSTDPELEALHARYDEVQGTADTLPPGKNSVRDKYARELQELEMMKAKFRRQQEEKLRQRSTGSGHRWTEKSATTTTASGRVPAPVIPGIAESYTSPAPPDSDAIRRKALRDSVNLQSAIRSGLYRDNGLRVYERQPWENTVRNDLPRTERISAEEAARLDAEYQRKQAEIAAMRAQLQRLNETSPAPSSATPPRGADAAGGSGGAPAAAPTDHRWTAKGSPAPTTYGNARASSVPASPPRPQYPARAGVPGIAAGISFIPNTAYPDGAGYTGLDQLVKQLKERVTPLEIRVHTGADLDRRAAQLLSEERAVTIRDYLLEYGIPAHLFRVVGFGNNLTATGGERVEVVNR